MELKEFVSETILQVIEGVNISSKKAVKFGAQVNPDISSEYSIPKGADAHTGTTIQNIDFDVAITTQEGTETKGSIGVFVGAIGLGTQGQSNNDRQSVSRIQFRVPVVLPGTPKPPRTLTRKSP